MKLFSKLLLALSAQLATATTLTYTMKSSELACFYGFAGNVGQKIAFYFAVQSGGDFDIDYTITSPEGKVITSGLKEKQVDYVFAAPAIGEYSFCFSNGAATFSDKTIDFDISVHNDKFSVKAEFPDNGSADNHHKDEHLSPLENSVYQLGSLLATVGRLQKYFRTRENRSFATVESTESRIFFFAVLESVVIVGMAALQVFTVRALFKTTNKTRI